MTIQTEIRARSSDGRLAARTKIVNSDDVASHLAQQVPRSEHNQQTRKSELKPHYIPSLARFGNPK